jgi:hypothetical protein
LRDASPVKENKSGGASNLSFSCRRLPGISTEYRIQVLSLRANDLCFRAGSAIDDGAAMRQRLPNRRASTSFSRAGRIATPRTYSCFPGSRQFAEIFLGNSRASDSDVDASAKDSAILASYLLTRGQSRFTP